MSRTLAKLFTNDKYFYKVNKKSNKYLDLIFYIIAYCNIGLTVENLLSILPKGVQSKNDIGAFISL